MTTKLQVSGGRIIKSSGKLLGSAGGGGGSSSLAVLRAGASSGTWTRWTQGDLTPTITNPGSSDPVTDNATRCIWLPGGKKWTFTGGGHGIYQILTLTFDDATSVWDNTQSVPFGNSAGDPSHQFTGQGVDSSTDTTYVCHPYHPDIYKRPLYNGSWASVAQLPSNQSNGGAGHGQLTGVTFNPHSGTVGKLVAGSQYGIATWNPSNNTWNDIWPGLTSPWGPGPSVAGNYTTTVYDPNGQCVLLCDAATTGKTVMRVEANESVAQANNTPIVVGINQSSDLVAQIIDGYISAYGPTSGAVRPALIVDTFGGQQYHYNGGADTWTNMSIVPPVITDTSENDDIIGYCETYDCVVYWLAADGAGTLRAWVYTP